jgi:hypothetical protein
MRLSFNLWCHAFVAFSPPDFRDKAPPEHVRSMQRSPRRNKYSRKPGPTKEMPE